MADLSPAAQAVVDAWDAKLNPDPDGLTYLTHDPEREALAAALRAAAESPLEIDIPFAMVEEWERIEGVCASFYAAAEWGYKQALTHFLAIAAELEGADG